MRPVMQAIIRVRRQAFEPDDTLIVALDDDIGSFGMIERRRNMRKHAERAAGLVNGIRCNVSGRIASHITMRAGADDRAAKRVLHRGACDTHHRDRRKKLHQHRDHDDGSETSQPLAHGIPYPARKPDVLTKHGDLEMSISRSLTRKILIAK